MRRLLSIMILMAPGLSAGEMFDGEYQTCNQNSAIEIIECVGKATQKWDKRLNSSYRELMKGSEPAQQTALRSAQRLWIQYRDANCGYYASQDGSISRIAAAECVRSITRERTCELEAAGRMEGGPRPGC